MSSTNRSEARKEHKSDYYITPQYAIKNFLNEFLDNELISKNCLILDPCAGGDKENEMSYPEVLKEFGFSRIITVDTREDSRATYHQDYLKYNIETKPDIIITNPPFNGSIEIIKKAIDDVSDNGFVIMLQRLNFMGGVTEKKKFWDEVGMPKYIFVHRKRMSFVKDGGTDSIEYAHYVWEKGNIENKFAKLMII